MLDISYLESAITLAKQSESLLKPEAISYVQSERCKFDLAVIEKSPELKARLAIWLLKHFAINPFTIPSERELSSTSRLGAGAKRYYSITLHDVTSPIPWVILPEGSAFNGLLQKAIQDNLDGPMSAAAKSIQRDVWKYIQARERCIEIAKQRSSEFYETTLHTLLQDGVPENEAVLKAQFEYRCRVNEILRPKLAELNALKRAEHLKTRTGQVPDEEGALMLHMLIHQVKPMCDGLSEANSL